MTVLAPETGADTTTSTEKSIPCQSGLVWELGWPLRWLNQIVSRLEETCPNVATWDEVRVCPDGTSHIRHSCDTCHDNIVTAQHGLAPCQLHGYRHENRTVACIRRGGAR